MRKLKVAVIGSGNIGTDLMIKIMRNSKHLEIVAMAGIDPQSDGLARAARLGIAVTAQGIDGLIAMPEFQDVGIVFDATSAQAHLVSAARLGPSGCRIIDLTPAAIGPFVVPVVNLDTHVDAVNLNMVTCGGQATIPIVAAINRVAPVRYAEIVASIASKSAGPGTRANIDEFTETTTQALREVGGAEVAKAIIILNPADPPMMMRDTVYTLTASADTGQIEESIAAMVSAVQAYVPGYRLKQSVQFDEVGADGRLNVPGAGVMAGLKTTVFLEVQGAAHYLPAYAGNLDIMTSAAMATADHLALRMLEKMEAIS
ncbi:acetaldehyde dehydrogenase (acetylating) [Variovorax boronicumulans]|uniref:Acetaldehyde dehydrogenase n=1 Tax=Variovorax boronicumulans TaxID=436515 RepID=A0A250DNP2_9BURK|nr:acetaldehyde dehydrogenase (acetylating) [Variovorax boronicumulans]ATA55609.1 acetaldehyde dehydrogenase (acetylating) [Variovorax boronicumulans]